MEIKMKFKVGSYLYTYRNGTLDKFRVSSINIKITSTGVTPIDNTFAYNEVLPAAAVRIEYEIWNGREHVHVPEESCFANEDEVRADLEKRFQELSNQES